jgi:hypothetical protein
MSESKIMALGTIIETNPAVDDQDSVYSGLLDYYDHWSNVDDRLSTHHQYLSRAADIFGRDVVNMATYAHEILGWLSPDRIRLPPSVVCVGGMTEAFLVSTRSAYDAVGIALSYVACKKAGQAPSDSLRSLITWARQNKNRTRPEIFSLLSNEMDSFWRLRSIRDHIVHGGAHATIHCTGRQFNLWLHSPRDGWITREPLLPLLSRQYRDMLNFADASATAINLLIDLPKDRVRCRLVNGVVISALHRLEAVAPLYADPSP